MRKFLIALLVIAVIAWLFLGFIVWQIPAEIDGQLAITNLFYFFTTIFIALFFSSTVLIYLLTSLRQTKARLMKENVLLKKIFFISVRRAFLLTSLVTSFTILKAFNLLNIFNAVLIVGIAVLAELYFKNTKEDSDI